jgi:hypothetical protein
LNAVAEMDEAGTNINSLCQMLSWHGYGEKDVPLLFGRDASEERSPMRRLRASSSAHALCGMRSSTLHTLPGDGQALERIKDDSSALKFKALGTTLFGTSSKVSGNLL